MTSLVLCRSAFRIADRRFFCGPGLFQNKFHPVLANPTLNSYDWKRPKTTESPENATKLTRREKLKRAVAEYGSTVIVFHIGISLVSLGGFYLLVSSGIDMSKLLVPIGIEGTVVANASTFVTAYAIHKVFAPVRISITLASTPFLVRYFRRIGFLKKNENASKP